MIHPTPAACELDIRHLPAEASFVAVLRRLLSLDPAESLDVVAAADPRALHERFLAEAPGRFSLNYIENGPERWRLRIARRPASHGAGSCCGSCGGN